MVQEFVRETIALFDRSPEGRALRPPVAGAPPVLVEFSRARTARAAAVCQFNRRTKQATLRLNGAVWAALTEQDRLDTILHETAHAIDFLRYDESSHGARWQGIAIAIGGSGQQYVEGDGAFRMHEAYRTTKGLPPPLRREDVSVGDLVVVDPGKRARKFGRVTETRPETAIVKGFCGDARCTIEASYYLLAHATDEDLGRFMTLERQVALRKHAADRVAANKAAFAADLARRRGSVQ